MNNPWDEITVPSANVKSKLVDHTHPIEISWAVNQEGQYLLVALFDDIKNNTVALYPCTKNIP